MKADDRAYVAWVVSHGAAAAVCVWFGWWPAATFAVGFGMAGLGILSAQARARHWREIAGRQTAKVQELQKAENARIAAGAQARLTGAMPPSESIAQQVSRLVPAKKPKATPAVLPMTLLDRLEQCQDPDERRRLIAQCDAELSRALRGLEKLTAAAGRDRRQLADLALIRREIDTGIDRLERLRLAPVPPRKDVH